MSIETVPGTDLSYYLIAYDKHGKERPDDPDGSMSERARLAVRDTPVTDVFIVSHGWKGDVPAAKEQYQGWIGAMAACADDRQRVRVKHAGFTSLIVGFHWPSQPWGDEEFGTAGASFAAGGATGPATLAEAIDSLVERYADRIADTPRARAALRTVIEHAAQAGPAPALPAEVAGAYAELAAEAGLAGEGAAGAPGADAEPFDAARAFRNANSASPMLAPGAPPVGPPSALAFGGPSLSGLLSPLRQLSFWKMKDRARSVGESAGFELLRSLQAAVPAGRAVRFHLVGHSFGCIVMSSMLNGPEGAGVLVRPIDSLTLIQGALSLWSYADQVSQAKGAPGYFRGLIAQKKVAGPIVTTRSKRDTAVGKFYPIAAGVALQVAFGPNEFPKYGGLGAFGIQGGGLSLTDQAIQGVNHTYGFQPGSVNNLECTAVIKDGAGPSGAHSDIAKPEVAHAMWDAVIGT